MPYESLLTFAPPKVDFLLPHGNWSTPPRHRPPDSHDAPYGQWLSTVFDRWYGAPNQETEVRLFAELINLILGGQSRTESVGLSPVTLITVNTDGSLEQVALSGLHCQARPRSPCRHCRSAYGIAVAGPCGSSCGKRSWLGSGPCAWSRGATRGR